MFFTEYQFRRYLNEFKAAYAENRHMELEFATNFGAVSVNDAFFPAKLLNPEIEKPTKLGMYLLAGTQTMFVRPVGEGYFRLAYASRNRLSPGPKHDVCRKTCKAISFRKKGECILSDGWKEAFDCAKKILKPNKRATAHFREKILLFPEWVQKLGNRAKKVRAEQAEIKKNEGEVRNSVKCFLKSDEVLFPRAVSSFLGRAEHLDKFLAGRSPTEMVMKPRVIQNVDTTLQTLLFQVTDLTVTFMKEEIFDGKKEKVALMIMTFKYGSGSTSSQLSEWYNYCVEKHREHKDPRYQRLDVIVCGDDFMGLHTNGKGQYFEYENDFGQFDSSEGPHCLNAELDFLVLCGWPVELARQLGKIFTVTPVYENIGSNIKEKMTAPIQRFSGAPDTTLGNSIINIMATLFAVYNHNFVLPNVDFEGSCNRLGLISKLQVHNAPGRATFLKGWFIPDLTGHFQWLPLPSQICKMGKILTDPVEIYKCEPELAYLKAARAMGLGMPVDLNYPILGALVRNYSNCTTAIVEATTRHQYKTTVDTTVKIDREQAIRMVCDRYKLEERDVVELEILLSNCPIPGLVLDSRLVNIARKDYG